MIVTITPSEGYKIFGADTNDSHTQYQKAMKYSDYEKDILKIIKNHEINRICHMTLPPSDEYGTLTYKLDGVSVSGDIEYGEGERICKQDSALTEYTYFLGNCQVHYLYWGDIDREGLNIFLRLCRANPGLEIRLFDRAYSEMLNRADEIKIPHSADERGNQEEYSSVYALFSKDERHLLQTAITENLRIPQEIISYAVLLQEMR